MSRTPVYLTATLSTCAIQNLKPYMRRDRNLFGGGGGNELCISSLKFDQNRLEQFESACLKQVEVTRNN